MKWEASLKKSSLKTEVRFIKKWSAKKVIKKSPDSAIATFLAIDELKNVDFAIRLLICFKKVNKNKPNRKQLQPFRDNL